MSDDIGGLGRSIMSGRVSVAPTEIPDVISLQGDTYPYRETIERLGGIWDCGMSQWLIDASDTSCDGGKVIGKMLEWVFDDG